MKYRLVLLAALSAAMLAACQLILGIEDEAYTDAGAGTDAKPVDPTPDASDGGPRVTPLSLCPRSDDDAASNQVPGRPTSDSDADVNAPLFRFFAVRSIQLTDKTGDLGVDLDGRFTSPKDGQASACGTLAKQDGKGGTDNALGLMLKTLAGFLGGDDPLAAQLNPELDAGLTGLLFEVANYNGAANDTDVDVALRASSGVKQTDGGGVDPDWDGGGAWPFFESGDGVVDGFNALQKGYVTEQRVVARQDDDATEPLQVPFFGVELGLYRGAFVAKLDTAGLVPILRGYVTGAVDPYALYAAFHGARVTVKDPSNDAGVVKGFCQSSFAQTACEGLVSYSDLPLCAGNETQAVDVPCGMISLAIGFEAYQIGGLGPREAPVARDEGACDGFDAAARICPDAAVP